MSLAEKIAGIDTKLRPLITRMPSVFPFFCYSGGRKIFLKLFSKSRPENIYVPPESEKRRLWDKNFACGLFNAAGMFKNGESYYTVAAQGAGAYLAGTTTHLPRKGNFRFPVRHPFTPYPYSGAASNWMGLPNTGHAAVSKKIAKIEKIDGCPIGVSISASPEEKGKDALKGMIVGMKLYSKAGADFIEINESCPNIPHETGLASEKGLDKNMIDRLEYISKQFLRFREKNLPVIVKLSTDTDIKLIPAMIDLLTELNYDGINLGNTSTDYDNAAKLLDSRDLANFRSFIRKYGGGVSGRPLKEKSLSLASAAASYIEDKKIKREFHIIRTGGIETPEDMIKSDDAGISLNQWFTGYFESYSKFGDNVYREFFGKRAAGK